MHRSLLLLTLCLAAALPVLAGDRAGTAAGGSCSPSLSCDGRGCLALCGSDGHCLVRCARQAGGTDLLTLDAQQVSPAELSKALSDLLGRELTFKSDESVLSLHVVSYPLDELVEALSRRGAVVVEKRNGDDRLSLQAQQVSGSTIAAALSEASGRDVGFTSGPLHLDIEDASLTQVLSALTRIAPVTLDGQEVLSRKR